MLPAEGSPASGRPASWSVFLDRRGRLRAGWRIAAYVPVVVVALAAGRGIEALLARLGSSPCGRIGCWQTTIGHLSCAALLVSGASAFLRRIDRRPWWALGVGVSRETIPEILWGAALGGGALSVAVFAIWVTGGLTLRTPLTPPEPEGLVTLGLAFVAAATVEELVARGYAFQTAVEGMGGTRAVVAGGVVFSLAHLPNQGVTFLGLLTVAASGVLLGLAYLRTRSLWPPLAAHAAWNWAQGCVWGMAVSGERVGSSLLEATPRGPDWLSGGSFGAEGSLITLVLLVVGIRWLSSTPWVRPSGPNERLWRTIGSHPQPVDEAP